jgi:hypothetical protein
MPQELYEDIIRNAFSYALKKEIGRSEDPAQLADTDEYFGDINRVKIGLGYAMEIFINDIINNFEPDISEETRLTNLLQQLISAPDLKVIEQVMIDYESTVFNKYFSISKGKITRK